MSQSTMLPTGICTGTSTKTAENADEKQPQPDLPRAEAVLVICYIRAVSTSAQSGRVSTVPMRMASAPAPISKNSTATCCGLQDHIFDEQGNAAVRIVE